MKNYELIFGIIWTCIAFVIGFALLLVMNFDGDSGADMVMGLAIVTLLLIVGLLMIFLGLKRYITDNRTERFGEVCFGRIKEIYSDKVEFDGSKELKAKVKVYIPSYNIVVDAEEIIGYDDSDYEAGDYVKVKYYIGDINFVSKIEAPMDLPEKARHLLEDRVSSSGEKSDIDMSDVDTENWTLTEEAFSSVEQFEENRTGAFVKKNPTREEKAKYPYLFDDRWKKQIKKYGRIIGAIIFIILCALFFEIGMDYLEMLF